MSPYIFTRFVIVEREDEPKCICQHCNNELPYPLSKLFRFCPYCGALKKSNDDAEQKISRAKHSKEISDESV